MDGVATHIDHIPKSRYCFVPVSNNVRMRNADTIDCRRMRNADTINCR